MTYIGPRIDEQSQGDRMGEKREPGGTSSQFLLVAQDQAHVLIVFLVVVIVIVTVADVVQQGVCVFVVI